MYTQIASVQKCTEGFPSLFAYRIDKRMRKKQQQHTKNNDKLTNDYSIKNSVWRGLIVFNRLRTKFVKWCCNKSEKINRFIAKQLDKMDHVESEMSPEIDRFKRRWCSNIFMRRQTKQNDTKHLP